MTSRYTKNYTKKSLRLAKHKLLACRDATINRVSLKSLYSDDLHLCIRDSVDEYLAGNAYYGLAESFRDYTGYTKSLPVLFEHGLYPTYEIPDEEIQEYNLPCVLTFGKHRADSISSKTGWPVLPVGPYIHYAPSFLSDEEKSKLKEQLGRVLMVIPGHGLEENSIFYDAERVIGQVKKLAKDNEIQTVIVCLYFVDIKKYAPLYEKAGFKVVCCGHRLDKKFLSRQKTYFELSDLVATNAFGTYIGYALALGKPVVYLDEGVSYADTPKDGLIWQKDAELSQIPELFSTVLEQPSKEQIELLDGWWGFSDLRSAEGLLGLFRLCENIHKSTRSSDASYRELILSATSLVDPEDESNELILETVR